KADLIPHLISLSFHLHIVELRSFRRPQLQIRVEIDFSKSASIRVKGFSDPSLRNPHGNSLIELLACKLHPSAHTLPRAFLKLNQVVVYKRRWCFNELYFTREPAVVPPVSHQRRHSITTPLVIHFDDEKITGVASELRDLEIERCEAAFV